MARTWAQILTEAIEARGTTPAAVARATGELPGGPIQRMTVGRQAKGEAQPNAKNLRLLCTALGLNEDAVRREIAYAPIRGDVFEAGEESRTLTSSQRETVRRVIGEMVQLNELLALHGIDPDRRWGATDHQSTGGIESFR